MGEDSFRLGFGKFRGRALDEVPLSYVIYLATLPEPSKFPKRKGLPRRRKKNAATKREKRLASKEATAFLKRKWSRETAE